MDNIMKDAYDLHIHFAPDVRPRKFDEHELAQRFVAAGMKGFAMKSHFTPTAERAYMINKLYPQLHVYGGVVMNSSVGGINPIAVETTAKLGGKFCWMPTFDARHDIPRLKKSFPEFIEMETKLAAKGLYDDKGIYVLDENGKIIPDMYAVLEVVKEYNMVLSTAHISHEETFALVKAAKEVGVERVLVQHVDWKGTFYEPEEQKELIRLGAVLEHCYVTTFVPYERNMQEMLDFGLENYIVSTDLGTPAVPYGKGHLAEGPMPYPDEAMLEYAKKMLDYGYTEEQVRTLMVYNPARLVEG